MSECHDCDNGRCTMNCGPVLREQVSGWRRMQRDDVQACNAYIHTLEDALCTLLTAVWQDPRADRSEAAKNATRIVRENKLMKLREES